MKWLSSKRGGKWTVKTGKGRKKIGLNPLYNAYRVFDRLIVGEDKPGNSW